MKAERETCIAASSFDSVNEVQAKMTPQRSHAPTEMLNAGRRLHKVCSSNAGDADSTLLSRI